MLSWQKHARGRTVQLFSAGNRTVAYVTMGQITSMIAQLHRRQLSHSGHSRNRAHNGLSGFFAWDFCAFLPGFGKSDRDCLFAALHSSAFTAFA
jgi:hypothetical protein